MVRILVVDDEPSVRKVVKSIFEADDCEVIEAVDGREALDLCKEISIDLTITDIVMPEKNGIDYIMELKKNYPNIPVVAISGGGGITGRYDYLEIAKLVGADYIVKKPFGVDELRTVVDSILKN